MTARMAFGAEFKVLFSAKTSIATATTTTLGADVYLPAASGFVSNMRILVVFDATTAGTTDTTAFIVQDADGTSGAIGTPATALTSEVSSFGLAGGTGDRAAVVAVQLQSGRPWLRLRTTRASGTTDTTVVRGIVLGVPVGLI